MKRKILIGIGIISTVIILGIVSFVLMMRQSESGLTELMETKLMPLELERLEDGVYEGNYEVFPIQVVLEVKVVNHIIDEITILKHVNGKGKPGEKVVDSVVEEQTLNVDMISGASYSSKVILKAIEDALTLD